MCVHPARQNALRWWVRGGCLALGSVLVVGWLVARGLPTKQRPEPAAQSSTNTVFHCRPGPWGDLECEEITLTPPDEFVPEHLSAVGLSWWSFPGQNRAAVERQLAALGLTEKELESLRQAPWEETGTGTRVVPPVPLLLGLTPEVRARLYEWLARLGDNPAQSDPCRLDLGKAGSRLANTRLAPATVALVNQLSYRAGGAVLFADAGLALALLPHDAARRELHAALVSAPSLLAHLRVAPGADVRPLVEYWGRGGRHSAVKPLLTSLAQRPGSSTIEIVYLLPPLVRQRLYTYPAGATDPTGDCHWSSLNFFRPQPNKEFATIQGATQEILENYFPVLIGGPMLGDLLLFLDSQGVVVHSCVFIADEIVFTKNGSSLTAPWTLNTLSQVLATYQIAGPLHIELRRSCEPL